MNASSSTITRPGTAWLAGGLAIGLLAASLVGPALGTARAQSDDGEQLRTISVSGTGRIEVTPDVADITLGVIVQDKTAKGAAAQAAEAMDAVVKALLEAGIAEKDIQTTQLSLNPVYDYDDSPPQIEGWEASNLVAVVVRDIDSVGSIIDASIEAGATSIQGINFRVEDPTEAQAMARSEAVADAKAKADQLAADAQVNITGVQSISEGSVSAPPPIYYERSFAGAESMDAAATPILPGSQELTVDVFIVYTIE